MDYLIAYVMAALGTFLVAVWAVLYFKYRNKYDNIISAIDKKKFMMSDLFFIGLGAIALFNINLKTANGRKKEKEIAEAYGERYAEFYHNVIFGGQITYALTIAPLGLFIGAMTNDIIMGALALAAAAALVVYLDMDIKNTVNRKRDEIMSDFPTVLSKLTLLVNAGLVAREAWAKVAYTTDRALYQEMQLTSEEIQNGTSDVDALYHFAQRCSIKEIRKFASILTQNLQKGSSELTLNLKYMTAESWEEKKHFAKRKGELASQKLLIPVMVMFVGVLLMVIVPILSNMF